EGERRVPRRAGAAGLHRRPHQAARGRALACAGDRRRQPGCRLPDRVRRDRAAGRHRDRRGTDVPDRRGPRGRHQAGPDRDLLAGRARADRQARGRRGHDRGAGRHPRVRDRGRALLRLMPAPAATLLLPARTRLAGVPLPADVARALGRADRLAPAEPGEHAQLARHFDLLPRGWPVAALTRALDAGDAEGAAWLRADPAHVRPDINGARLLGTGEAVGVDDVDVRAFLPALRPLFGDAGFLLDAPDPHRWYLRLPREARLPAFVAPADALGADLFDHLPGAGQAAL